MLHTIHQFENVLRFGLSFAWNGVSTALRSLLPLFTMTIPRRGKHLCISRFEPAGLFLSALHSKSLYSSVKATLQTLWLNLCQQCLCFLPKRLRKLDRLAIWEIYHFDQTDHLTINVSAYPCTTFAPKHPKADRKKIAGKCSLQVWKLIRAQAPAQAVCKLEKCMTECLFFHLTE